MRIKLCRDSAFAPCCFILARELADGTFADPHDEANTMLVSLDWDYPGIAGTFGWRMSGECHHSGTDGTVDCPDCGITASTFITAAGEWLHDNIGAIADDPGYF